MTSYDTWFASQQEQHLAEHAELVGFPTVASQPEHAEDVKQAAEWLKAKLNGIGLDATIHPAGGYPIVTAEWLHAEGQPTVLI